MDEPQLASKEAMDLRSRPKASEQQSMESVDLKSQPKENGQPPKLVSEFVIEKKQIVRVDGPMIAVPANQFSWFKLEQVSRFAQAFVLTMLIAAIFAGIPFMDYFRYIVDMCSMQSKFGGDYITSDYDCYDPLYNSAVIFKNIRCMVAGFSLMLIALLMFSIRAILYLLPFVPAKLKRLVGLGLDVATLILIFISIILVTSGGTRHTNEKGETRGMILIPKSDKSEGAITYSAALNVTVPMQAIYWSSLLGMIPVIIFDVLAFIFPLKTNA